MGSLPLRVVPDGRHVSAQKVAPLQILLQKGHILAFLYSLGKNYGH
jgi:hypothetical protein